MHGCRPTSDYRTITRADGNRVLELDGRPALDVMAELLGLEGEFDWRQYAFFMALGVNKGDPYGEFREEDYAVRLCAGVDRERKALKMYEPDLGEGTKVQLMRRSIDLADVSRRAEGLLAELGDRRPVFAFYVDCGGRAGQYCGHEEEDANAIRQVLRGRVPLLGVYVGAELAPVRGRLQAMGWSGVLTVFTEGR
jgi:hypothetical protein